MNRRWKVVKKEVTDGHLPFSVAIDWRAMD